jgi:predicted TIM-barrel fold metal-dependent hydrolase
VNESRRQFLKSTMARGTRSESFLRETRGADSESPRFTASRGANQQTSPASRPDLVKIQSMPLPTEATKGPWRNLRAVKEKKVIDFHTHTYETPVQGTNYKEEAHMHDIDEWSDFTDGLIRSMDLHGVVLSALTPAFVPYETVAQTSFKAYPDRFVRMTSGLTTRTKGAKEVSPTLMAELYREQFEAGARGIGETNFMLGVRGDYTVKDLGPIIDLILEYDAPVLLHTGWGVAGQRPHQTYKAAWRWAEDMGSLFSAYPEVTFVLGHTGGVIEIPDARQAIRLAFSFDNTCCEVSKSPRSIITEAVRGIGAERVLFGSDWNRVEPQTYGPLDQGYIFQQWYTLNHVAEADITEDQKDQLLYKTARRLLKLGAA